MDTKDKNFNATCGIYLGLGDGKIHLEGLSVEVKIWEYVLLEADGESTFFPEIGFTHGVTAQALADIRSLIRHTDSSLPCTLEIDYKSMDESVSWRNTFTTDGLTVIPFGQNLMDDSVELAKLVFTTNSEVLFGTIPDSAV